jgi:glutathione S-transferase
MMQLLVKIYLERVGEPAKALLERVNGAVRMHLAYIEESLGSSQFLTGSTLTVADVQMSFPLEVSMAQGMLSDGQPRLKLYWLACTSGRRIQAALAKGGPYAYAK